MSQYNFGEISEVINIIYIGYVLYNLIIIKVSKDTDLPLTNSDSNMKMNSQAELSLECNTKKKGTKSLLCNFCKYLFFKLK